MPHKLNSQHAQDLADGRVVLPGETVTGVDTKDPHNKRLIDEGVLVAVQSTRKPKREK